MQFWATAIRGTERVLADELREIGVSCVTPGPSGVAFQGALEAGWRVCLYSRIASAVQLRLAEGPASTPDALYDLAYSVDWGRYLSPKRTLAVQASCRDSRIRHSGFAALRVKDSVVDQFRDRHGARPSVDRVDPDVQIVLRLVKNRAWIGLDLAGEALHRRGYRSGTGAAPLRETLAAALLRLAEWDCRRPLLDPMCGSGTLLIEGALWAARKAPGLFRSRFGFERWCSHDDRAAHGMASLREEARSNERPCPVDMVGGDVDGVVLERARASAKAAGMPIRWYRGAAEHAMPRFSEPALIVTNPPYGHRMGNESGLYERLAQAFRQRRGDTLAILSGNPDLERAMKTDPAYRWELKNGSLPCRLLVYNFVAVHGVMVEHRTSNIERPTSEVG